LLQAALFAVAVFERTAKDLFAPAEMVRRCRINIIDAVIYGIAQLPDRTGLIDPAAARVCRQPHAAEPEDREFIAGFWDCAVEHERHPVPDWQISQYGGLS
jgi:hypothetical protein